MEQIDKSDGKFRASSVPPVSSKKGAEPNGDNVFDPQSDKSAMRLSSEGARMVEVCLARATQNDRTMAAKEAGDADACRVVVEQGVVQGNALALIEGLLPETDGEEEEKKKKKRHFCLAEDGEHRQSEEASCVVQTGEEGGVAENSRTGEGVDWRPCPRFAFVFRPRFRWRRRREGDGYSTNKTTKQGTEETAEGNDRPCRCRGRRNASGQRGGQSQDKTEGHQNARDPDHR